MSTLLDLLALECAFNTTGMPSVVRSPFTPTGQFKSPKTISPPSSAPSAEFKTPPASGTGVPQSGPSKAQSGPSKAQSGTGVTPSGAGGTGAGAEVGAPSEVGSGSDAAVQAITKLLTLHDEALQPEAEELWAWGHEAFSFFPAGMPVLSDSGNDRRMANTWKYAATQVQGMRNH